MQYFDGSFVKIRNVTLGYNFPTTLAEKMKMQSLRLYVSAQQPLIFSRYIREFKGIDPERVRNASNGREQTSEVSFGGSPSARLFLFGLNAKF
jgi:hypothetical protein